MKWSRQNASKHSQNSAVPDPLTVNEWLYCYQKSKSIIQWEEKSSRILTSTFSTTDKESKEECDPLLALTKVKDGSVKEKYYRKLQITTGYQRNCNLKILLGDMTYCQNLM